MCPCGTLYQEISFFLFFFLNHKLFWYYKMATVHISSNMVKPLIGKSDMVAWLKKVKLVSLLLLYLERDALALYLKMDKDDQMDINQIEAWSKEIFTDGAFTAYRKLTIVRWFERANGF